MAMTEFQEEQFRLLMNIPPKVKVSGVTLETGLSDKEKEEVREIINEELKKLGINKK